MTEIIMPGKKLNQALKIRQPKYCRTIFLFLHTNYQTNQNDRNLFASTHY